MKKGLWASLFSIFFVTLFISSRSFATPVSSSVSPSEFALFEEIPKVTSASRMEESILEAPAAISVITGKDLERWGIVELPDAFRFTPGVDVMAFTERDFGVTARGFDQRFASKMLFLIDDMSAYMPLSSGVLWANLALINEDIDSIEVIRGANDTLYGFNAFNGVINVKTKDPKDTHGFFGKYIWGSNGRDEFVGRYGEGVKLWGRDLDFRLTYSYDESGGYADDEGEKGRGNVQDWRRLNLLTSRSRYEISDKLNLEAMFGFNYGHFGRDPLQRNNTSWVSGEFYNFQQTRLNAEFTDTHKASLQLYRMGFTTDAKFLSAGLATQDTKQSEYDLQFIDQFSLWEDKSQTVWGGNLRYHGVSQLQVRSPGNVLEWITDNLYSFFINEKYVLLKDLPNIHKLTAVAGVRGEGSHFIPEDNPEWAPRASILYEPVQNHVFRATYARGFRLPQFTEKYGRLFVPADTGATSRLLGGDQDIGPEKVTSYELGYSGTLLESKLSFDADIYAARYDDLIHTQRTQAFSFFPSQPAVQALLNPLNAKSVGVELAQSYKVNATLDVYANYTWEDIDDDFNAPTDAPFRDETPKSKANFGFNWRFLDEWNFNLNMNYRGSYSDYTVTDSPITKFLVKENLRTDIRVARSFFHENAEVAFSIQNLTGKDHFEAQHIQVPQVYYVAVTFRDWPWNVAKNKK